MDIKNLPRFDNHSHSEFSNLRLIDSINRAEDMILTAHKLGMKGIALTDHETVSGHVKWLNTEKELKKAGKIPEDFKCACGNEIYLVDDRNNIQRYWHFILIAKNTEGHRALRELSSIAWYNGFSSKGLMRVPTQKDELAEIVRKYPNTLIATSACFVKGTLVLTRDGKKKIEDITDQDYILNRYGEWEKVNFPTCRDYVGEGKEIYFLENPTPTVCTANHQFLVTTNNKIQYYKKTGKNPLEWIEAKDLNVFKGGTKHICVFPVNNFTYSNKDILYKKDWKHSIRTDNYSVKKEINSVIKITPEVMRLFGLWLGDGHISIDNSNSYYNVGITFSSDEFDYYWNSFIETASKEIGIDWSIQKKLEQHKVTISSHSVELTELFYYLFGNSKANNKNIPERLKHISKELDFNLFMGYALADGHFRTREKDNYKYGEYCSASISEQLTKDFQELLKSLGIRSSITQRKEYVSKDGVHHQNSFYLSSSNKSWTLIQKKSIITNEDILNYMNIATNHDNKKFIEINGVLYKKVFLKEIKTIQLNEKVHCLNVNSHSFCCNGVIVHNCLGGELPHLVAKLVDAEKKGLSEEEILNIKLEIVAFLKYCVNLFGEDFYIEIAAADSKDQKAFNQRIKSIAESQGIKIVIGSDAHYLTANERELHKAYLNSKEGEREVDNFYYFAHMMDNEEAFGYISDIYTEEEFIEFCDNSMEIYDKIEGYDIFRNPIIPEVQVKNYIPFTCETDFTGRYNPEWDFPTIDYLLCSQEIQERYWINECLNALHEKDLYTTKYLARIETEARVIKTIGEKLGDCLFKYFNTFQHFIDLFWECGSLVGPGRGSAVCFLSNYLLGITQLDPVVWNLPYWRFLNEERVELPKLNIGQYKIGEHIQWCA